MTAAVLYDELRREMPEAPLCRICGGPDYRGGGCGRCFERGLHDPNWTEAQREHRCADCGEVGPGFVIVDMDSQPPAIKVCAEHYAARMGMHAVWCDGAIGDVEIVTELPADPLGVTMPERVDIFEFQSDRPVRSTHEPARIFDELAAHPDFCCNECRPLSVQTSEAR